MKKNKSGVFLAVVVLAVVGVGGFFLKDYYDGRYKKSDTFYVLVPQSQETTVIDIKDSNGKVVDRGRDYTFTGYNEKGNAREVSFSYQTTDASKLLQPGQYLAVDVSKTIVIGQEVVSESSVPEAVKPFLK
ncbi:YxeA family protein [Erysipelothrix sp. HDW6B]|uniref:YxeA family protein n=1 Tax=Erysipelothrix TaxID=1647 RepID=UPI00135A5474|nr:MULTISPECIES: YxeA family protein [Erysipelothrix]QIK86854.1 YxeA family protein [Erysipelothrix sp. HDW6B]